MAEMGVLGLQDKNRVAPEKALGTDIRIADLPTGLKFYINQQEFDFGRTRVVVNLYKLVSVENGAKLRRSHVEKFINDIPDEEYIALKYGPHKEGYMWIAKWTPPGEEERSMASPEIHIDESWRGRYEEAQRKARGEADPAARAVPAAPAPAPAAGPSFMELLALVRDAEDRAYNNLQKLMGAMKSESPTAVLEKGVEAVGRMVTSAVEMQLGAVKKLQKRTSDMLDRELNELEGGEEEESTEGAAPAGGSGLPPWLEPLIEKGQKYLGDLLSGGPVGAFVKNEIVSSEMFKEIFSNKDKWEVAVKAMREHFGEEKAEKAIGILLGAAKKKGK